MRRGMPKDRHPDLPPGVSPSMLPGNRPQDVAMEVAVEDLAEWLASEFDTVDEARAFLSEQWSIDTAEDMTEYDLVTHLVDEHYDTVRSILGYDEDHDDSADHYIDQRKDEEAMENE